jgi:Leucine-rich repeat (LRR) protein
LKNDHLKEIQVVLQNKTLKSIDLSGNDFAILPSDFSNLKLLEEIRLNDESRMDLPKHLMF